MNELPRLPRGGRPRDRQTKAIVERLDLSAGPASNDEANRLIDAMNLGNFQRLAAGVGGMIGLTSFFGLRHVLGSEGGMSAWIIPLALAVALALTLAGAWHVLLATAARSPENRPKHSWLLASGCGLVVAHVLTSSLFMATAIGGATALQHHRYQTLNDLTAAASSLAEKSERDRALRGELVQAQTAIDGLISCEVREGCLSGTPGSGTVTRGLEQVARSFQAQAQEFDTSLARRPTLLAQVREQIERARRANLRGDEDNFGAAINAASNGLRAAEGLNAQSLMAGFATTSRIPQVEQIFSRLRNATTGGLDLSAPVEVTAYEPLDRSAAVMRYAEKVPFAWGVAIAVDALPLALLILLILSVRRPGPDLPVIPYDFDYDELIDHEEEEERPESATPTRRSPNTRSSRRK
ncbi:hypothetical protein RDV64_01545 [Acuticoccus sp. MNP-M23]|uniref:hypothetical protein n=1 Tax=Acuticoccus sp. MNP-M23 TaxID=3072793 RepID=UPI002816781C|nr:hypothetical protein [Acuticoccus sp. MNP-M23]WMS43116.1 hypothetical protein RDV64_01545 [Acuticoccus sp. MNP-M23]